MKDVFESYATQYLPNFVSSILISTSLLSPLNLVLLSLLSLALYSLVPSTPYAPDPATLPGTPYGGYNWRPVIHLNSAGGIGTGADGKGGAVKWRKWTPKELSIHDGTEEGGKGKVLVAVRRKVYDVSSGRNFYGPGGPYSSFAGRDASRGLSKQSFDAEMLTPLDKPIDPLDDLVESEWNGLREWEEHFRNKYPIVGDLVEAR
ncbi:hypothetical protein JCM11251_000378 [Rhodosporidiobolus azoricus]